MIRNLSNTESRFILKNNYIGHLGYIYHNKPFVVPITYFFNEKDSTITCYSGEGHKIKAMRQNSEIALEVSEVNSVNNWKSVMVQGTYIELEGSQGKAQLHEFSLGVKDLLRNKENLEADFISEFSSKIYKGDIPIVFCIKIEEITGKTRLFEH